MKKNIIYIIIIIFLSLTTVGLAFKVIDNKKNNNNDNTQENENVNGSENDNNDSGSDSGNTGSTDNSGNTGNTGNTGNSGSTNNATKDFVVLTKTLKNDFVEFKFEYVYNYCESKDCQAPKGPYTHSLDLNIYKNGEGYTKILFTNLDEPKLNSKSAADYAKEDYKSERITRIFDYLIFKDMLPDLRNTGEYVYKNQTSAFVKNVNLGNKNYYINNLGDVSLNNLNMPSDPSGKYSVTFNKINNTIISIHEDVEYSGYFIYKFYNLDAKLVTDSVNQAPDNGGADGIVAGDNLIYYSNNNLCNGIKEDGTRGHVLELYVYNTITNKTSKLTSIDVLAGAVC